MPVPYPPMAIANEFLARFNQGPRLEHMKVQKLVYCAYGWWLGGNGLNSERLTTEGPEIWRHGPVFSSIYKVLKNFGAQPIPGPQSASPFQEPARIDADDDEVERLLVWIWGRYGHLSGFALSDLTHRPGSPWHRVAVENNFRVPMSTEIPDQYILEEYQRLLEDDAVRHETELEATVGAAGPRA